MNQIAVGTRYNAITGPETPFGSNCQMQDIVSWAPISFASSVAFDSVVLLLTLCKIRPNLMMAKSAVGRQIFRDTLIYFTVTAVTNITVLSIQSLGSGSAMIKPTAVPFSTLMTVTMGSRVYINLKLLDKRRQQESERIPLSMPWTCKGSPGSTAVERSILTSQEKTLDNGSQSVTYITPYPSPGVPPYTNVSDYPKASEAHNLSPRDPEAL